MSQRVFVFETKDDAYKAVVNRECEVGLFNAESIGITYIITIVSSVPNIFKSVKLLPGFKPLGIVEKDSFEISLYRVYRTKSETFAAFV